MYYQILTNIFSKAVLAVTVKNCYFNIAGLWKKWRYVIINLTPTSEIMRQNCAVLSFE